MVKITQKQADLNNVNKVLRRPGPLITYISS